uniref:Uncharacterized protein n=1 Tax=Anguilla anguilla TaxID=7936 RepID=A0A0E9ULG0_ANGAN
MLLPVRTRELRTYLGSRSSPPSGGQGSGQSCVCLWACSLHVWPQL